jgi:hypothetical protein
MKKFLHSALVMLTLLALSEQSLAQQRQEAQSPPNPLVRILQSKGVITEQEAAMISGAPTEGEAQQRLAKLLLTKGILNQQEYDQTLSALGAGSAPAAPATADGVAPRLVNAAARGTDAAAANDSLRAATVPSPTVAAGTNTGASPAGGVTATAAQQRDEKQPGPAQPPAPIPAVSPLRVLPITTPRRDNLLPDIKLFSTARVRPYGFIKVSAVHQSASSGGLFGADDFPLPLLLADTGPDSDSKFHIKDRATRLGLDFEWPDVAKNLTLTGKIEFDFEGNFTNVNNRNISSVRSSQPSLRLAWVRLDTKLGDLPWFVQFGQDWSVFGSSTLADLFETTAFGIGLGNIYERMPMIRTGVQFGKKDFRVQPEIAIALPGFGEPGLNVDERTRFGSRVGPESGRPEVEARVVFQFPLARAAGVVPAQIIFSYDNAERAEIVPAANLPAASTPAGALIRAAFPTGARITSQRNAWSAEFQLPTPYATIAGKYYHGGDLRFYFGGQLNDVFTDIGRAAPLGTALSQGERAIPFGLLNGRVIVADLEPVHGQGGFLQLGLPLSRIFGARPEGRAAGWSLNLIYGVDSALAKDAVRANGLLRTDMGVVQLRYRLNRWVTFIHEETYIDTRTVGGVLRLFRGVPVHEAHAWRSEFGPIFTF